MKTITQKELSKKIGVDPSWLSKMLRGEKRPNAKFAALLEKETGIGIRVWLYSDHSETIKQLEEIYGPINRKLGRPPKQEQTK